MKMKKFQKKGMALFVIFTMVFTMMFTTNSVNAASNVNMDSKSDLVLITDDSICINGKYYTEEEFEELLNTAVNINVPQNRIAGAIAGTWFIPGVGEVVITATGVILIGGVVVGVGTWAYNKVMNWFKDRAYKEAKEKGTPTDNHSTQVGGSLPTKGSPRSSKDLKDKNGKLKQRRYYDEDGNADMDIDYSHGGVGHKFPHRHDWNNGTRGPGYEK